MSGSVWWSRCHRPVPSTPWWKRWPHEALALWWFGWYWMTKPDHRDVTRSARHIKKWV